MENKEDTGNKLREYLGEFAKFSETFDNIKVPVKDIKIKIHLNKITFSELYKEIKLLSRTRTDSKNQKEINVNISGVNFTFTTD